MKSLLCFCVLMQHRRANYPDTLLYYVFAHPELFPDIILSVEAASGTSPSLFALWTVLHLVFPGDPQTYIQYIQSLHHKLCMNPKHQPSQTTTALHQGQAVMNLIVQLEEPVCILLKQSAFH